MAKKHGFDYFDSFKQLAAYASQAVNMLHDIIHDFKPMEITQKKDDIHKIETEADDLKFEINAHLIKEFLPPIESEDIVELAMDLDDITDAIEDILLAIYMFDVQELRDATKEFVDILVQCSEVLSAGLDDFKNFKKSHRVRENIEKILTLEETGDRLYIASMKELNETEKDPLQVIAWARIYDAFEKCCDKFEIAAVTMETVILKNS